MSKVWNYDPVEAAGHFVHEFASVQKSLNNESTTDSIEFKDLKDHWWDRSELLSYLEPGPVRDQMNILIDGYSDLVVTIDRLLVPNEPPQLLGCYWSHSQGGPWVFDVPCERRRF